MSTVRGGYEAAFIFLMLLLVEWIIPGPASLAQISPHPFWLPVILISVQYGSTSGLVIAGVATALSWVAGWPGQGAQEDFYSFSMRIWREPVLWIFGALIIGSLRDRQIGERRVLQERLQLLEQQRDTIGKFSEKLEAELTEYERQSAIRQEESAESAIQSLHHLRLAKEQEAFSRVQAMIAKWLGETVWTLYLFNSRDASALQSGCAWPQSHLGELSNRTDLARTYALVQQKKVLSIFDEKDSAVLDGLGVFAGVLKRRDGSMLGLFVVKESSIYRLTPAMNEAISIVVDALFDVVTHASSSVVSMSPVRPVHRDLGETTMDAAKSVEAASIIVARGSVT